MAAYTELRGLFNDSELLGKIEVATIIAANNLIDNIANNAWVAQAYTSPKAEAKKALMAVLATNSSATVAQILEATDSTIQTAVDAAVETLVKAKAGA
jgi:hypothetical protein